MKRILQNSIAIAVVVIVLFIIVPLPTQLLDVLLVVNISLSMLILVITMTVSDALDFSIFPSLLLITTLFRLGLNVSTTRQILGRNGDAGNYCPGADDRGHQGRGTRLRGSCPLHLGRYAR